MLGGYVQTISVRVLIKKLKGAPYIVGVFPSKQAMLRLIGAICVGQNEEWYVSTHFMGKRSLLFEERIESPLCAQETIEQLLQVIDSDFKACREVA